MEGDAGAGRLNPADAGDAPEATDQDSPESSAVADPTGTEHADVEALAQAGASRLGRRWLVGSCAALVLLAVGLAAGGFFGLRSHRQSENIAGANAAAVAAAKDCVIATQAPDSTDVAAAEQKILDCAAGEFRTQALLHSGVFVQAYRAADVHVQVSEMRAAVERDNADGSVDVLVAFRVKVDNVETRGQEFGYRLRAQMTREEGQYRIAKLDQVAR
jgi:Mce-associated membrane protein